MACLPTYKGVRYNSIEELKLAQQELLNSPETIAEFKEFVSKDNKELNEKLKSKLQELYPEIKLEYSNTPIWEKGNNVFNQEEFNNQVQYRLKATEILLSTKADEVFRKGDKNGWEIDKILNELNVPKQQQELIKSFNTRNREQIITNLLANYSYTVEINTAKEAGKNNYNKTFKIEFKENSTGYSYYVNNKEESYGVFKTKEEAQSRLDFLLDEKPTQHYSNLSAPGGTNYTENEIATPAITPSIKGHAEFATDKGIGWFRSDDRSNKFSIEQNDKGFFVPKNETNFARTRRILEVQSDLFQKGRDKEDLISNIIYYLKIDKEGKYYISSENSNESEIEGFYDTKEEGQAALKEFQSTISSSKNQFLQLLNKDNNWVTFFVKSIIQDSAKKGYEKVLFPVGDTAAKIEGHETVQGFIDNKEERINELNKQLSEKISQRGAFTGIENTIKQIQNEIKQLEKEIEDAKAGKLKISSIANFYETTVANILKKQGYNPVKINDEYGNGWYEVGINQTRELSNILLQRNDANKIIGQANIKAMTVLIDAVNQKADTLPHEYAHHYISWYRNSPIVQEAIKKWGSEEALVQSIGEQVVAQKGEALNWWNSFAKWIIGKFDGLSKLDKERLTKILTDAFLTRQNLGNKTDGVIKNNNQQDIRGREPVHMTRTAIDLISELLPKDYSITYSKGMVSIDSPIEIRRGKVKTNTTLGNYLKSLYGGTAPESVDLDQVDRQKVKGAIDYYDKIKNEINFTYDKTKEDMTSCGIKIKAL